MQRILASEADTITVWKAGRSAKAPLRNSPHSYPGAMVHCPRASPGNRSPPTWHPSDRRTAVPSSKDSIDARDLIHHRQPHRGSRRERRASAPRAREPDFRERPPMATPAAPGTRGRRVRAIRSATTLRRQPRRPACPVPLGELTLRNPSRQLGWPGCHARSRLAFALEAPPHHRPASPPNIRPPMSPALRAWLVRRLGRVLHLDAPGCDERHRRFSKQSRIQRRRSRARAHHRLLRHRISCQHPVALIVVPAGQLQGCRLGRGASDAAVAAADRSAMTVGARLEDLVASPK